MPVYFICRDDISQGTLQIPPLLAHHLKVLRYQPGDALTLVDEIGTKYSAEVVSIRSTQGVAKIVRETIRPAAPAFYIHLGVACIQKTRMEWVIEKSVELGVMRISPLITRRVTTKPHPHRTDHQQKRWEAIAREAAQQSERWEIPSIDSPMELDHFLKQTEPYPLKFIFWEKEVATATANGPRPLVAVEPQTSLPPRRPTEAVYSPPSSGLAVLIGPEGGWEDEEVDKAKDMGYRSVSLGDRPLRADTAVVAALTLINQEIQNG